MDVLAEEGRFSKVLGFLIFLTVDLMILGAGVRAMDAGLTCPDWPLCFGNVIPAFHFGVYLEFVHRAIAGLVALIFTYLFFKIFTRPQLSFLKMLASLGLVLLIAQIVMGGLTVLKLLEFWTVTLHLMLATGFLAVLLVLRHRFQQRTQYQETLMSHGRLTALNLLALLGVLLQMFLGGLVASTYSGLICVDFPTCNGQLFPKLIGPIGLQMMHRWGAFILVLLVSFLFYKTRQRFQALEISKSQYRSGLMAFLLVWCQVGVGIMNLSYLLPPWLTVIHSALAILIFINLLKSLLHSIQFSLHGSDFELTVHRG